MLRSAALPSGRFLSLLLIAAFSIATASAENLTLTWTDNSLNELGFTIERSADGITFKQIGSVGTNVTSYVDSGVGPGQYWYRVRAYGQQLTSNYSDVVTFTIANTTSAKPPGTADSSTSSQISTTPLLGTVIGSSPWSNQPQYSAAYAFDKNPSTFFAGNSSDSRVYVGYDFGTPKLVWKIRYFPRTGFSARMVGGRFCGANSSNLSDAVTLATITSKPAEGTWSEIDLSSQSTPYRYVFYTTTPSSAGDIAELEFYGPNIPNVNYLSGTAITSGAWNNNPTYGADKAFDGDPNTTFSGRSTDRLIYVGLDLGTARLIDAVVFYPRVGYASRMLGGRFCGANRADLSDAVTLATITTTPIERTWVSLTLPSPVTTYRYVFYTTASSNYGDVAELEFYGH